MTEAYELYLEGLVNELMHILQRHRKEHGFNILDQVELGLVQDKSDKLTSAIYYFVDRIIERIRIIKFVPIPIIGINSYRYNFTDPFGNEFIFDIYMK